MDHKILILGITIFIVILLLSFRKEKYENEEDIGEVEVPPSFNISEFLKKLQLAKEEKRKNDETLDALYDINRDENQDSQEEAAAAIEEEDRAQYTFLKDLVNSIQQDEDKLREKARNQVKSKLEKTVTDQARDYFENKSTGFENLPTPKKKGIVKVDNVNFNSFAAALSAGIDISTYGGTNVYGTGEKFYSARVPYCHKRPALHEGATGSQRQKYLQKSEYSCLTKDGVPGDVGENGFKVDSFEECASKCLTSDLCSGFSIVPDATFPKEGFGMTCKMTHHEFEDTIIQDVGKNEQVFAVHEDDKLKNPLYFHIMDKNYGGGTESSGFLAAHSMGQKGSDFHEEGGASGSQCYWRSACDYSPYCTGTINGNLQKFQKSACENGVVIPENGIRRDCDGAWVGMKKGGDTDHDWIRIEELETIDQRVRGSAGGAPAVCSSRSYPYDGKEETFEIFFQKAPGGKPAVNGGSCPSADKIEVPCGQERAPAPPANEPCELERTETFGSKYTNDSGNYCVRNGEGVTRDRTWTVTKAAVGDGQCAFDLKNVGDTKTISGRNVDGNPQNYPECPAYLFKDCVKYESRGACENLSEGNCGKGTKKVSYVVSQQPGRYGSQCGTVGVYKTEKCEKPCNQEFCTAKTLNKEACPDSCKRDVYGQCCAFTGTVFPNDTWGDNEAYEVCVPARYGKSGEFTGGGGGALNRWYKEQACQGVYPGDTVTKSGYGVEMPSYCSEPTSLDFWCTFVNARNRIDLNKGLTCQKSEDLGTGDVWKAAIPFAEDGKGLWGTWADVATYNGGMYRQIGAKGSDGILNARGVERPYFDFQTARDVCEKPHDHGLPASSNPGDDNNSTIHRCKLFHDIDSYGKGTYEQRKWWYNEMNKY